MKGKNWTQTHTWVNTVQTLDRCRHHQGTTKSWKRTDPSPVSSEGARPYWYLDFRPLVSNTIRKYISVVQTHLVRGTLLQWPQQSMNIWSTNQSCWFHISIKILEYVWLLTLGSFLDFASHKEVFIGKALASPWFQYSWHKFILHWLKKNTVKGEKLMAGWAHPGWLTTEKPIYLLQVNTQGNSTLESLSLH